MIFRIGVDGNYIWICIDDAMRALGFLQVIGSTRYPPGLLLGYPESTLLCYSNNLSMTDVIGHRYQLGVPTRGYLVFQMPVVEKSFEINEITFTII